MIAADSTPALNPGQQQIDAKSATYP
jgi:hypothetical protein